MYGLHYFNKYYCQFHVHNHRVRTLQTLIRTHALFIRKQFRYISFVFLSLSNEALPKCRKKLMWCILGNIRRRGAKKFSGVASARSAVMLLRNRAPKARDN